MPVRQLVNFDFPCSRRTSSTLIYDVLAHEIWFTVQSFRYAIWLGLERSIARVKATTIRTVHRRHAEEQLRNQLITLSQFTLQRPTARRPGARSKIDDRTDRFDIVSRAPFRLGTRGRCFAYKGRTWHGTARRIAGWAIPPRVLLRTREIKARQADAARYCARDRLLRRPRRAMKTSDGDVSRFTARNLISTGSYDLPLDLWPSKRTRWAIRREEIIDSALKIDRAGKAGFATRRHYRRRAMNDERHEGSWLIIMILIMKFISPLEWTMAFVHLHNGIRSTVPLWQRSRYFNIFDRVFVWY